MSTNELFKGKLRNVLYELMVDHGLFETPHQVFEYLIKHIDKLLHVEDTKLYYYDPYLKKYYLVSSSKSVQQQQLIKSYMEQIVKCSSQMDKTPLINMDQFLLMKLQGTNDFRVVLIIENKATNEPLYPVLVNEIEKFIIRYSEWYDKEKVQERNNYLYILSTQLMKPTNVTHLLIVLVNALEEINHQSTFQIYLSLDYELDESLPVKLLEMNHTEENNLCLHAFMTGEMVKDSHDQAEMSVYVPLIGHQGTYGVIKWEGKYYTKDELKFLKKIAKLTGLAIENTILYQSSNHLITDLKLLNEATHQLNANVKLNELIKIVKKQIVEVSQASEVGFIFYQEEKETPNDFKVFPGSTSYFYSDKGSLFVKHLVDKMREGKEPIFSTNYQKYYTLLPYASLISIPMKQSSTVHGMIVLLHEEESFFTFEKFKLLQSLIQHSTLAMTNTLLKEELRKSVITDYLTKLYTRNYLDEMIKMHMEVDQQGAFLLFDIDDFKKINDTHGHYVGDQVIIHVANIIRDQLKGKDIPARWGGEELAVYLPHNDIKEGLRVAEQIRAQVELLTEPGVTVSCGISGWTSDELEPITEIFLRADKALYQAKRAGKNNIVTQYSFLN